VLGSRHLDEIPPYLFKGLVQFENVTGYFRDIVVKPLGMVLFALLVGAAVSKSEKPEKFLVPMLISVWVMVLLVVVFVLESGHLERNGEQRVARVPFLARHARQRTGALYAVAYALLLFTWVESKNPGFKLALIVSMGLVVFALVLTFSRGASWGSR